MIAGWIITGISWAVTVSSMVIMLLLVAGVVLGFLKLIFGGRGNNDAGQDTKNDDDSTGYV